MISPEESSQGEHLGTGLKDSLHGRRRRGGRREKNERTKRVSVTEGLSRASLRPFLPLVWPAKERVEIESSPAGVLPMVAYMEVAFSGFRYIKG